MTHDDLPMPHDVFDGGTVIASQWLRDGYEEFDGLDLWISRLIVLDHVAPFYRVVQQENGRTVHSERFDRIDSAVEEFDN